MLTITEHHTKEVQTEYKLDKKNVFTDICNWFSRAGHESEFTVDVIYLDRVPEFLNNAIPKCCSVRRTKLKPIIGQSPESNDITERCNCSILERLIRYNLKLDLVSYIGIKLARKQHISKIEVQYQNIHYLRMKHRLKINQLFLIIVSEIVWLMIIFLTKNVQSSTMGVGKEYLLNIILIPDTSIRFVILLIN